jgi:hypothetical protein
MSVKYGAVAEQLITYRLLLHDLALRVSTSIMLRQKVQSTHLLLGCHVKWPRKGFALTLSGRGLFILKCMKVEVSRGA